MEIENQVKTINFLDLTIINNQTGKYEFKVHRKNAITNVQINRNLSHDPKIINGVFKGFVKRAITICSNEYQNDELAFLKEVFCENGYVRADLERMVREILNKNHEVKSENDIKPYVSLPWVPGLSVKLKKIYKKFGYKAVFKSSRNLKEHLTTKNKPKLPDNSQPKTISVKQN